MSSHISNRVRQNSSVQGAKAVLSAARNPGVMGLMFQPLKQIDTRLAPQPAQQHRPALLLVTRHA